MAISRKEMNSQIIEEQTELAEANYLSRTVTPVLFSDVIGISLSQPILKISADESQVISLGWFFRSGYRTQDKPFFNEDNWSRAIFKLKGYCGNNHAEKITFQEKIIPQLADILNRLIKDDIRIVIVAVPSSTAGNPNHGATKLAQTLANLREEFDCGNSCLIRQTTVPSSHSGARSIAIHERTIVINEPAQLRGKVILLIDDIVTTGTIINVCKRKLEQAGAAKVICLTLGRTVSSNRCMYYDLPEPLGIKVSYVPALRTNEKLAKQWYNTPNQRPNI